MKSVYHAIDHGDDMLIVPMIGVLIMHDILQTYVTMKVIVITSLCDINLLIEKQILGVCVQHKSLGLCACF